jgi:hypothetical protein
LIHRGPGSVSLMYSPDQVPTSWLRSAGVPSRRIEGTVAAQAAEVSASASANTNRTTRGCVARYGELRMVSPRRDAH